MHRCSLSGSMAGSAYVGTTPEPSHSRKSGPSPGTGMSRSRAYCSTSLSPIVPIWPRCDWLSNFIPETFGFRKPDQIQDFSEDGPKPAIRIVHGNAGLDVGDDFQYYIAKRWNSIPGDGGAYPKCVLVATHCICELGKRSIQSIQDLYKRDRSRSWAHRRRDWTSRHLGS